MKPLIFLTVRGFINGVRRALTSPQRLIGLIFLFAYWFRVLLPATQMGSQEAVTGMVATPLAQMPPIGTIEACVFGAFTALTLPLMLALFAPKSAFRQSDVDVLFPTPIEPKLVLIFRIVRDAFFTLLLPLFFAVFARPATLPLSAFIRDFPAEGNTVTRVALVSWLLATLAWTCIGHGLAMFVNRSDERSDKNKRILEWTLALLLGGATLYIGLKLRADASMGTLIELAHDPLIRGLLFTATFATSAVMAGLRGDVLMMFGAWGALLMVAGLGLALAMSQISYMYDQAAARGFDAVQIRQLQRSGNMYAVVAEQARRGKTKGRGRLSRWISRATLRGAAALLWKDLLLQSRGAMVVYIVMLPLLVVMVVLPTTVAGESGMGSASRPLLLVFLLTAAFMTTAQVAMSGFSELLRRVDFQKPLPFSMTATMVWEVIPKAIPAFVTALIAGVVSTAFDPSMWDLAVAGLVLTPSLALVLAAVTLLVTILFPDVTDATQSSFRGLMVTLGSVIAGGPMVAIVIVMMMAKINGVLIAIPGLAVNLGIAFGLCAIAGGLYAGFNPSE